MKLQKIKSSINIRYYLFALLFIITATTTTNFFSWGMAGLTVFMMAYLSKGMRRVRSR